MSKREPFIIQPGVGGLEGRARLFDEQARGAHNERIYQWLKERAASQGQANAPVPAGEIVVPVADLILTGNGLQAHNNYNDNDGIPKAATPNAWPFTGAMSGGIGALAYRNVGGGTGRYLDSLDTAIDLPVLDHGYMRLDNISGGGDSFQDDAGTVGNSMSDIVDREGNTGQGWCWMSVVRIWNRHGAAGTSLPNTLIGGRFLGSPFKGYSITLRSASGLSTCVSELWWIEGTTTQAGVGLQTMPIGNTSAHWVVYVVQSEPSGRFIHGFSRDYQDCDILVRTGDIRYRDLSDGAPHYQFGSDGSNNSVGDMDFAEMRWFNRALSPAEFNIAMADLLVEYDLPVL